MNRAVGLAATPTTRHRNNYLYPRNDRCQIKQADGYENGSGTIKHRPAFLPFLRGQLTCLGRPSGDSLSFSTSMQLVVKPSSRFLSAKKFVLPACLRTLFIRPDLYCTRPVAFSGLCRRMQKNAFRASTRFQTKRIYYYYKHTRIHTYTNFQNIVRLNRESFTK